MNFWIKPNTLFGAHNGVYKWCVDNFGDRGPRWIYVTSPNYAYGFRDDADAMLFTLRWK
jgi:hypothetical protein